MPSSGRRLKKQPGHGYGPTGTTGTTVGRTVWIFNDRWKALQHLDMCYNQIYDRGRKGGSCGCDLYLWHVMVLQMFLA